MRRELVKFILRRRFDSDSDVERRINICERRKLSTYIENDRRSGVTNRACWFILGFLHEYNLLIILRYGKCTSLLWARTSGLPIKAHYQRWIMCFGHIHMSKFRIFNCILSEAINNRILFIVGFDYGYVGAIWPSQFLCH